MHDFIRLLYPICRSITGKGVRQTLGYIQQRIPITIKEIPSGTTVFDWTIPDEWNVERAYIVAPGNNRFADVSTNNLHLVSYSVPFKGKVSLGELRKHLHTLSEQPDLIPYRTSYYNRTWGFCISHRELEQLPEGEYDVVVDTSLVPGSLTYGEMVLKGKSEREFLISCHICHPSLANDNLSGISLVVELAEELSRRNDRQYTYRFLFIPGTIGAISWLYLNQEVTKKIEHGLVAALVGRPGPLHYKKSRRGSAKIDKVAEYFLAKSGDSFAIREFAPFGYDERQFCSPAFDLPVGSLTRTPYGEYPEYHTSADDLSLVTPDALADSLSKYLSIIDLIEKDLKYQNLAPFCEPQLGKRGLFKGIGGSKAKLSEMAMLWVLNLSDGKHSLLDIAARSGIDFDIIHSAAQSLRQAKLLEEVSPSSV